MKITPELYLIVSLGGTTLVLGLVALLTAWQIRSSIRKAKAKKLAVAPIEGINPEMLIEGLRETERSLHKVIDLTTRRS